MKKRIFYVLLVILAFGVIVSVKGKTKMQVYTTADYLDTVCDITVASSSKRPLALCEEYLQYSHAIFDPSNTESDICKYNNGNRTDLSEDFTQLLAFGEKFSNEHSEYFSIYLEPLIKKWNITENPGVIPDVSDALSESELHESVDFGGIAKGYISDMLAERLTNVGVNSALINLGGNTYAIGKKPTGEPWQIGIQNPRGNNVIGVISAENLAVVTSGDYQRFFELDGTRYHHILDPKTGFPVQNGVHSVTVIHKNALLADALSTSAFVAGVEKGNELLKEYDALGIFITDSSVYFSKELENIFKQNDFSYKYEFLY